MVRKAFTLIELIFAIVIIGISVMSLPTMNQAASSGIEGNLVQEAIFAASTELNQAVSANWDEASLEPGALNSLAKVIDDGTCQNDALLPTYRQKPGHVNQPLHRRCLDSNATSVSNSTTNADVDALEDMQKSDASLSNATSDQAGYKSAFTTTIEVTNSGVVFGTSSVANPNMKRIKATIKDANSNVITTLTTYSANVGEIDYYKRNY